jgi:hypothetical protein
MSTLKMLHLDDLPQDIYRIIFEYVTLEELLRFDSASTSQHARTLLLSALDGISLPFLHEFPLTTKAVNWILLRNISVQEIAFQEFGDNAFEIISKFRLTIKSISFAKYTMLTDDQFIKIGHCPSLNSILVKSCYAHGTELEHLLTHNPQLEQLDLGDTELPHETVSVIANHCPNLTHLILTDNSWVTDDSISLLVRGCPNLKYIDLRWTDVTLESTARLVVHSFPHLSYISTTHIQTRSLFELVLEKVVLPAIFSNDVERQMLGAHCLNDFFPFTCSGGELLILNPHSQIFRSLLAHTIAL